MAFVCTFFNLEGLTEDEDTAVMHQLVFGSRRKLYDECTKYDCLFMGAMEYCESKVKKLDKALWTKNIKTMEGIRSNTHNYDKVKRRELLMQEFEMMTQAYKHSKQHSNM